MLQTGIMQEILKTIKDNAPMSLAEIIQREITDFTTSAQYANIIQGENYYRNRTDVQTKSNDIAGRSNVKMEHPQLKKLVDQKANYLLSKPFSVDSDNKDYSSVLGDIFDDTFRKKIKSLGKGAVKSGIAYLAPYFDEGILKWMRLPSNETIPLWTDTERTKLGAYIRFYNQIVYEGREKKTITRVEYWDTNGVQRFKSLSTDARSLSIDTDFNEDGTNISNHFEIDGEGYNFKAVPLVWLKYNEEELPLQYFIKDLIDDYNWQSSVTSDELRDIAKFIFILKNYGGADLGEFVTDLKKHLAIKVEGDGGVDKLQADLNIDAAMKFLEKNRRDLFDFANGVDTKDPNLGTASGTAINFRYMDLDTDCTGLANELQDSFQRMKLFIDVYLQAIGKGDFSKEKFTIDFNMDMPVNETDIITNCKNSVGIISNRTIIQKHPWVIDVDEEEKQIEKEKKESMDEYGSGLFADPAGDQSISSDAGGEVNEG